MALPALASCQPAPTGGHVLWLVRRVERLAGPVQLLVALRARSRVQPALCHACSDHSMRLIAASTGSNYVDTGGLLAQCADRQATLRQLARALSRHHLALTVLGRDAG